ncbi:enediyne biosynthesis protein UnbU [Actinomadura barringtoniae]|uniref:Enediyne biosynthesis protein UnbU n=1 Tax=Actinomadura barringtoniae TaxID=1427535 RepID=A0A939PNU1_9ACTN|nr:enediyne biosynthesis protein UnbU [Actinomadura barringtoniae]MBO2455777.1 enediyne biosynthesis protein UnbU [Actinomadura barringtoniae]
MTLKDPRVAALRRFAMSITALTVLGHLVLGFEQAYLTPVVAVLVAYALDLALETLDALGRGRLPKYFGGRKDMLDFLLPAHITGLACAMLLFASSRLGPVIFAVTVAIASKYVFRMRVGGKVRHVLNPSNFGIAMTLLAFPWVGIAPPYEFTERIGGPLDWLVPAAILAAGTMLNAMLTKKIPLIAAWVGGFALQAIVRGVLEGTGPVSALLVMSGTAFVLFTNYMITDPGTTPVKPARQAAFGFVTAIVYGLLVTAHIAFGLFFALVIVCAGRGACLALLGLRRRTPTAIPPQRVATGTASGTATEIAEPVPAVAP